MPKVSVILGTRPEAIKLIPVYLALKSSGLKTKLISTGQHKEMLDQIFEFFGITPDDDLQLMTKNQSLAGFSSLAYQRLDELMAKDQADVYLVQGDTTTAMIASTVAFYQKRKVGHVEAGLRTGDIYSPYPEEFNRRVISLTADYNFAPTQVAYQQLMGEKVAGKVWITGNTVIDSLLAASKVLEKDTSDYKQKFSYLNPLGKNILVTCHRRESFGEDLSQICEAIAELCNRYDEYIFVYPVHLNPNVRSVVGEKLSNISNLHLIDPVAYPEMIYLMKQSYLAITDSGGIQEEAPSLDIPVVVMRNHTERQEGVEAGCSVLVGTKVSDIVEKTALILNDTALHHQMSAVDNPYGDGTASEQIVNILKQEFN